jgi:hypothetical protein
VSPGLTNTARWDEAWLGLRERRGCEVILAVLADCHEAKGKYSSDGHDGQDLGDGLGGKIGTVEVLIVSCMLLRLMRE